MLTCYYTTIIGEVMKMSARQVQRSTVLGEVYKTLKTGIMTLQLPPGTTMSTQEMADRLNVSRTPVREAFLRLQEEGLLEYRKKHFVLKS